MNRNTKNTDRQRGTDRHVSSSCKYRIEHAYLECLKGRLEGWKDAKLKEWKDGRMGGWKEGLHEWIRLFFLFRKGCKKAERKKTRL